MNQGSSSFRHTTCASTTTGRVFHVPNCWVSIVPDRSSLSFAKVRQALGLFLHKVYLFVLEARFTHRNITQSLALNLFRDIELRNMLRTSVRRREMVQILEPVLMYFVGGEGRSLRLQREINETSRARLCHSHVI